MKKVLFFAILATICASCGPKVHHMEGTPFIYVETKEGRLYGVETFNQQRLAPIWNAINADVIGDRGWQAVKDGRIYLFDEWGNPLCDSIPLREHGIRRMLSGGGGVPGDYYLVFTIQGTFGLFYDNERAEWYQYGPFKDYVSGTTGYMFKDNTTGKWGVAAYGKWTDLGATDSYGQRRMTLDSRWKFSYSRSKVLIAPQYEQMLNIAYRSRRASVDGGRRGYTDESDIKWYAFDGRKWLAFDIHGNPATVKTSELNLALKLQPHQGRIRRNSFHNVMTQRLGHQEASLVIINNYANRP